MHHFVCLHVLLAAESLSTDVAVVEAGGVASLVNEEVVRLGEGPVAPATVVRLCHRPNLECLLPAEDPGVVHIDTQAHGEHLHARSFFFSRANTL